MHRFLFYFHHQVQKLSWQDMSDESGDLLLVVYKSPTWILLHIGSETFSYLNWCKPARRQGWFMSPFTYSIFNQKSFFQKLGMEISYLICRLKNDSFFCWLNFTLMKYEYSRKTILRPLMLLSIGKVHHWPKVLIA